jgi:hypothetical protein
MFERADIGRFMVYDETGKFVDNIWINVTDSDFEFVFPRTDIKFSQSELLRATRMLRDRITEKAKIIIEKERRYYKDMPWKAIDGMTPREAKAYLENWMMTSLPLSPT